MPHHFLGLQPLVKQCDRGNTCATRSLQAALGSPRPFYPAFYQLLVAYALVSSDKMLRLERPAAQEAHHLRVHMSVARRCHTRPQDSSSVACNVRQNLEPFLFMRSVQRLGLVRGTPPCKTLPTIIELPYALPPAVLPR
jgi:hypothetical protein